MIIGTGGKDFNLHFGKDTFQPVKILLSFGDCFLMAKHALHMVELFLLLHQSKIASVVLSFPVSPASTEVNTIIVSDTPASSLWLLSSLTSLDG